MTLLDALDRLCAAGPHEYRREPVGRLIVWRMLDTYGIERMTESQARAALAAVEAVREPTPEPEGTDR